MSQEWITTIVYLAWLTGAACFVLGLHQMNSPATARNGNRLSAWSTCSSFESLGLRAPRHRKTAETANNFRIATDYNANQPRRLTEKEGRSLIIIPQWNRERTRLEP